MNFEYYLKRWQLEKDGQPIFTQSSLLLPVRFKNVRYKNKAAMLKIAISEEERRGSLLMVWWNGQGAAPVFHHEGNALLMQRAEGSASLSEMAESGQDEEASRLICSVIKKLHANKGESPGALPLSLWFKSLELASSRFGGLFTKAFITARKLLTFPEDIVVLHGDIHHENILDFGNLGWLAIDPKHLIGERGFDYANVFCNPSKTIATCPERFSRQVQIVAEAAQLNKIRLLKWISAYSALSAAWFIEDGESAELPLIITNMAEELILVSG
ncbi:MAG: 3'-kinase [Tatlockia sp.]|nr:3'-kinase [Tatlockia sp.]